MPLPDEATPVTLTESFTDAYGALEVGTVTFTPSAVVALGGSTITMDPVVGRVVAGQLVAANGTSPLILAATDDTDQQPTGWTYRVDIAVGARRRASYYVELPSDPSPRVLHTLAPLDTPPVTGIPLVRSVNGVFPDASGNVDVAGGGGGGGVPTTRRVNSGTGLSGGGDLSADRTLVVTYGTSATSACRGDDVRLADARTPLAHTHAQSDVVGLAAALAAKATKLVMRSAYITTGDANPLPNTATAWQALTGYELQIPAAVGDTLEMDVNAMRKDIGPGNSWLDTAVVVGSTLKRFLSSGGATPALEGDPGWYVPQASIIGRGGTRRFTVAAGDLDSGVVRFVVAVKSNGTGILYSSADYPFYWQATNYGVVG